MDLSELLFLNKTIKELEEGLVFINKDIEVYTAQGKEEDALGRKNDKAYIVGQLDMLKFLRGVFCEE